MRSRVLIALAASLLLAACANRLTPPPSCDGGDRRPMNAGKWSGDLKTSFNC
jgi:hypothetical protein